MVTRQGNLLELSINIEVRQSHMGLCGLSVRENFTLLEMTLLEICRVLGQFHDLAEKIKKESVLEPL